MSTTIFLYAAPWCSPCRYFKPIFEDVVSELGGIEVKRLNIDELAQDDLRKAMKHNVKSVPTLVKEINDIPVATFVGTMTEPQLRAFIG